MFQRGNLRRVAWMATAAGAALGVFTPAWAQETRPPRAEDVIVVTGERQTQVADKAGVGLLGQRSFLETPFSVTAYTEELLDDLQAKTIGEALEANPSVSRQSGRFFSNDGFNIRGFSVVSWDIAYDGLYGLANTRRNNIVSVERIELLRGPSALLNGVPPNGSIGGAINLVPKFARDEPNANVELSFVERANYGASIDLGRRFGADDAFGVRFNASRRDGRTPLDFNTEDETLGSLALDYDLGRFRLFSVLNYEDVHYDAAVFSTFTLAPGVPVPRAPDGRTNIVAPFTFTETSRLYGYVRGEFDITENWTASLAYGGQEIDETQYVSFGRVLLNAQGDLQEPGTYRFRRGDRFSRTLDAKLRGAFDTGPLTHAVAFAAYRLDYDVRYQTQTRPGSGATSNLYDLRVNYAAPNFSGAPISLNLTDQTLQGVAIADTIGVFDERLLVTLGLRRQSLKSENIVTGVTTYDGSATTPAIAALWRATENISLYGNYIEGLSQAPSPPTTAINFDEVFPPAKSTQYEFGVKVDHGALRGSLALFEIEQPSGILDLATNIFAVDGRQRHRGVELELFGDVTESLRVLGGATWLDAQLARTQGGVNEGNRPVGVAEWTISLGGEWDVPLLDGLTLTGRWIYNSDRYLDAANTQLLPDWSRFDAGARYDFTVRDTAMTARVNVTNVFDENYWEESLTVGPPRYVQISLSASF